MPPPVIQQRPATAGRHILSRNCREIATRAEVFKRAEKSKGNANQRVVAGATSMPVGAENARHLEDFESLLNNAVALKASKKRQNLIRK